MCSDARTGFSDFDEPKNKQLINHRSSRSGHTANCVHKLGLHMVSHSHDELKPVYLSFLNFLHSINHYINDLLTEV